VASLQASVGARCACPKPADQATRYSAFEWLNDATEAYLCGAGSGLDSVLIRELLPALGAAELGRKAHWQVRTTLYRLGWRTEYREFAPPIYCRPPGTPPMAPRPSLLVRLSADVEHFLASSNGQQFDRISVSFLLAQCGLKWLAENTETRNCARLVLAHLGWVRDSSFPDFIYFRPAGQRIDTGARQRFFTSAMTRAHIPQRERHPLQLAHDRAAARKGRCSVATAPGRGP
jgi:hypothetical protein